MIPQKLHELFMEELDFPDSSLNDFIDALALNIILRNLSLNQRNEFYRLINNNDQGLTKKFITETIPDFYLQITKKLNG